MCILDVCESKTTCYIIFRLDILVNIIVEFKVTEDLFLVGLELLFI